MTVKSKCLKYEVFVVIDIAVRDCCIVISIRYVSIILLTIFCIICVKNWQVSFYRGCLFFNKLPVYL